MRRWDRLLGRLVAWLLRALGATWRVETRGRNPMGVSGRAAEIGALWHRDVLLAAVAFRGTGASVPISRSRDGDRIAAVLQHMGYADPPRGSSSRGGAMALRGMVRRVQSGVTLAVPTDGPRGPAGRVKPGILMLASLTGVPITPVSFAARPAWRFGSWDRTMLPAPFARVVCAFGPPLHVPRDASDSEIERLRAELERSHGRLSEDLDRELG